jgi:hypothetical protein
MTTTSFGKAQVLVVLHGAQLAGFLDGTNPASAEKIMIKIQKEKAEDVEEVSNPAYAVWSTQEQQVLNYLLASVSHDVLIQVAALPSVVAVWKHIETSFTSQSRARVINTRMALVTTQKGSSMVPEYISKMKMLADDMALAGTKLDDEELCSYILAGLNFEYNSLVSSIAAPVEPITLGELYFQILSFETRLDLQNGGHTQSSANNVYRGRGSFSRGCGGSGTRGGHARGRGRGDPFAKQKKSSPPYQLWQDQRFDASYVGKEKSVNTAHLYGVDSNWYVDSRATDYVTGELDKLTMKETYNSTDQIYTCILSTLDSLLFILIVTYL